MMYFKPIKKDVVIDCGHKRQVRVPMFNVIEVDEVRNILRVRASTGALMDYYDEGNIRVKPAVILKLKAMTDKLAFRTEYTFEPL